MYADLGLETLSPLTASAIFGALLGLVFGAAALHSQFCLRRSLVGDNRNERSSALAVWLTALLVAVTGTQLSVFAGWIDFSDHRFHSTSIPYALIVAGGLLFGAGMVLTRGCASRLSVLAGSGNLRALTVIMLFAIAAHATLKGFLSPLRTYLADFTYDTDINLTLTQSPMLKTLCVILLAALAVAVARNSRVALSKLATGALIGALVPIGWVGTGFVLFDDFDPIVFQSLSFTSPGTDLLFWTIASTSTGAGFGVGLLLGVVAGSALLALMTSTFEWQSFSTPAQTGRYTLGGILMGVGGVFAGGCTVGAGLSGIASFSISAALSLVFIIVGAKLTNQLLQRTASRQDPLSHRKTAANHL